MNMARGSIGVASVVPRQRVIMARRRKVITAWNATVQVLVVRVYATTSNDATDARTVVRN